MLVTGATGFLGSHLCRALLQKGAEVYGVARTANPPNVACTQYWALDVADYEGIRRLWEQVRPDLVFHLAGHANARRRLDLVMPTFHSNVVANVNLLAIAAELGCRRIVINASMEEPVACEGEFRPASPYAASKLAGTIYSSMFYGVFDLPVVTVRIFYTYGPGQDSWKIIPYIVCSLLRGERPHLLSGDREVDWVYIDDIVKGFIEVASAPDIEGAVFELGSGTLTSVGDVASKIRELIGTDIQPTCESRPQELDEVVRRANIEPALKRLGWKPEVSLEEGLRRTIEWYAHDLDNQKSPDG